MLIQVSLLLLNILLVSPVVLVECLLVASDIIPTMAYSHSRYILAQENQCLMQEK